MTERFACHSVIAYSLKTQQERQKIMSIHCHFTATMRIRESDNLKSELKTLALLKVNKTAASPTKQPFQCRVRVFLRRVVSDPVFELQQCFLFIQLIYMEGSGTIESKNKLFCCEVCWNIPADGCFSHVKTLKSRRSGEPPENLL